nr:crotonase/enoyl-CoA hydratase family protein [Gammaproteobacteria bacterium]
MTNYVRYEQDEDVAILNMDDGKANAYGPNMIAALSAGLDRANADARAIVVAGRPGVLCAGFDLKVIRGDDDAARDAMRVAGRDLLVKTYLHPQPVVFACTGHALAAGALFLMTGDYRIGAQGDFKIGLNESAIGLSLPVFGLELARDRLDPKILSDATIGARIFAPDEAVSAGYLDATVPEAVV